jgi:hypothetical protein
MSVAVETMTVQSTSATAGVNAPLAPTTLRATLPACPQLSLTFCDNATNETRFIVERRVDRGPWILIRALPARNGTWSETFVDATTVPGVMYGYRAFASNIAGTSDYAAASVIVPATSAIPTDVTVANGPNGNGSGRTVYLTWSANTADVSALTVQRATNAAFTSGLNTVSIAATAVSPAQTGLARSMAYDYRTRATTGPSSLAPG